MNASFSVKAVGKDAFMGSVLIGEGTARDIESFGGRNADALLSTTGELNALRSQAAVIGYTLHWNETTRSGLAYSTARLEDDPGLPGSAI